MAVIEKNEIEWNKLTMPSAWGSAFAVIVERVQKLHDDYITDKRGLNYAEQTVKMLKELVTDIENEFKPKAPRTLKDAQHYALTRNFKGTYMALLDEKGNLVKALIVEKGTVLKEMPTFTFEDREVTVTMKAKYLVIPNMNIEKSIPRKVVKAIPFACDQKKILNYG
jgi:hypothetical protein